jgi:membrane associated rhomboid family serine protease
MSSILIIVVATVIGYFFEQNASEATIAGLALWPLHEGFKPWQLITYAFLHANASHLLFNMLGLWMFGRDLEYALGKRTIFILYFASVLTAGIAQLLVSTLLGNSAPTIGASGGVFGVLLAYGLCFPTRTVVPLIPPIPMPAWLFVTLYGALELILGVTGSEAGVAHFAHLGGMVGGYLVLTSRFRRR